MTIAKFIEAKKAIPNITPVNAIQLIDDDLFALI